VKKFHTFRKLLAIFFLSLVTTQGILADAWYSESGWRRRCRGDRYHAHGHLRNCNWNFRRCQTNKRDCNFAYADGCINKQYDNGGGTAKAFIGYNSSVFYSEAYTSTTGNFCGGDNDLYNLNPYAVFPFVVGGREVQRSSKASHSSMTFDVESRMVTVRDVRATLSVDSDDLANDFTALAISFTEEDSTYQAQQEEYYAKNEQYNDAWYFSKLVANHKLMLNNGKVTYDGGFVFDRIYNIYDLSQNITPPAGTSYMKCFYINGKIEIEIYLTTFEVQIPATVNIEDLTLNVGVDSGNLGYGISPKFQPSQEAQQHTITEGEVLNFTFRAYPNPANSETNLQLSFNQNTQVEAGLYSKEGAKLQDIYVGTINSNADFTRNINLSNLPADVYYVRVKFKNKTYARKIIIKR
jgi:hypothetical protein